MFINNLRDVADQQRDLKVRTDLTAESIIEQQIAQGLLNKQVKQYRIDTTLLIPLNKKFGKSIGKDVLPFAEKLAGVLGLSAAQIENLTDLQKDRDDAQSDLNRALEEEGLLTAQEALRKKELQQQIAELTFFQGQGKNVTEELAVAQEELRLIELALTRESDQLVEARKRAAEAQENLDDATNNGTNSMNAQLEAAQNLQEVIDLFNTDNFQEQIQEAADVLNITWKDALDKALAEYRYWREQVTGKTIVDKVNEFVEANKDLLVGLGAEAPAGGGVDTPAETLGDQSGIDTNNGGGGGGAQTYNFVLELDGDVLQKYQIKSQQQGKTYTLIGQ